MNLSDNGRPSGAPSSMRMRPYRDEARRYGKAAADELYRWDMVFSGVVFTQISYVDMAARNAVDSRMRSWSKMNGMTDWIGETPDKLWFDRYVLPSKEKRDAYKVHAPKPVITLIGTHRPRDHNAPAPQHFWPLTCRPVYSLDASTLTKP